MGRKIFISYKYNDYSVPYNLVSGLEFTRVRHYVDILQTHLDANDHINKGEQDGEDLRSFTDETIASRLRDKIYDSSLTIVMISRGMKDVFKREADQWIPWEISYSLKEHSRNGRIGLSNALLGVVLPDARWSYDYFIQDNSCHVCHCQTINTEILFGIMAKNMFNTKQPIYNGCQMHAASGVFVGDHSYLHVVKWHEFIDNIDHHINIAYCNRSKINDYKISKIV